MRNFITQDIVDGLKNPLVKRILPRYIKVTNDETPANFQIAKRIVVDFDKNLSNIELWCLHEKLMEKFRGVKHLVNIKKLDIADLETPRFSLLDLKILLSKDLMSSCELCERKCNVNRLDEKKGVCGVDKFLISSEFVHMCEEPFISPSYTIFLMGCNFNCQYCQNWTVSHWMEHGKPFTPSQVANLISSRIKEGCRNVNFVGGEPTPSLLPILKSLNLCKSNMPVVWNSNFYMGIKTMQILDGIVDLYLPDFKYGNNECASALSKVPNYFDIVSRNHLLAAQQTEVTVRHLILPNHIECCSKPVLNWIAKNIRKNCIVNLMDQYMPEFKAKEHIDINRKITKEEFEEVVNYAKKLKINFVI